MADSFELPRYCGRCGEIFDGRSAKCPECGGEWPRELPENLVACYSLLLTEIQQLRRRGEINVQTFSTLRRIYEDRLIAVRPPRKPKAARVAATPPPVLPRPVFATAAAMAAPSVAIPARPTVPVPPAPAAVRPPAPPKPPSHVRQDLRDWAARRQADLVLYLGAFLLTISALIFASYQGGALSGFATSGLFAGYTGLFLVFGLQLRKWRRVQEAGPVFLAIGAVLTPLNFVALYTNVLREEDVAQAYVWFAGGLSTTALYALFAWKGFGKLYWLPAGGAAFATYASLGACFGFPREWFGPWFLALAVAANFVAPRIPRFSGYVEGSAYALGLASLFFTHSWVAFEGGHHAALPAAHALAFIGLCRSAFPSLRPLFIGLLPVAAVTTLASTAWAIEPWRTSAIDWAPVCLLAVSAGYLVAARTRPALSPAWSSLSLASGVLALGAAHVMVADGEIGWRLPVAYSFAASIAWAWFIERRYIAALVFVPALLAATGASALWAADRLAFEWLGSFAIVAAIGYLVLARERATEAYGWRGLAAVSAVLGLVISHAAAAAPDIQRWELAAAYGLIAAGAAFDALRLRGSSLVSLFALAAGGAAALWALEIGFAYWAFPALALALCVIVTEKLWRRDETLRTFAWPAVAVLAATPIVLLDSLIAEPWIGAANFAATALAMFVMALRTNGAFAALAGYTSEAAARVERQMLACLGSWALFATGGFIHYALGLSAVESAWTFAAAAMACALAVALLRSRIASLDEVLGPVGLSAVAVAVSIALPNLGHSALILAAAGVASAVAVGGRSAMAWRVGYAGLGALALLFAHDHALEAGIGAWQLPAVYGLALAGLLWDSARNRFQPAMIFIPAVAAAGATAFAWWQEWPLEHRAWAPLGIALALVATERLWMRGTMTRKAAWPYVLALSLAPVLLLDAYESAAWAGVAAFALATAAWTAAVLRSNAAIVSLAGFKSPNREANERQVLAVGAFGLLLATIGHGAFALEIAAHHAAWAVAGASVLSWFVIVALRNRIATLEDILGPASMTGIVVAVFAAYPHHEHTALLLGSVSIAAALTVGGRYAHAWRLVYGLSGAGALLFAHNHAELAGTESWQLPAAYGLALAALLWDSAWNRFQPAMLFVPAVAAAGATAFAWWQEWPVQHMAWAPLGIALAIAATERLWMRGNIVRQGASPYVIAFALVPFALLEVYREAPWAGTAAFAIATLAWASAAWRSNGALGALFELRTDAAARGEQHVVALGAFALGLLTLAHANYALEVPLQDAAWTFAAVGAATLFATCLRRTRVQEWHQTLTIAGIAATTIGVGASFSHTGQLAAMFALAAGAFAASGWLNRSSARVITAGGLGAVAAAFTWAWADWPLWSLALAYAGGALVLFAALAPARKARSSMQPAVDFLSVAPMLLAVALSAFAVILRDAGVDLGAFKAAAGSTAIVTTPEWAAMVAIISIAGLMLVAEGLYRTGRGMAVAGTAVVLLGIELGIAMLQAANIQVYTAPVALNLIGLGLSIRRSEPLFGHNMLSHEVLFVLGAALLALPPAAQSFSAGGENWGLLVIVQGMGLLALGLALAQRWLAVSGVVTLVGVAGRFVFDNTSSGNIPYWVMLGVAGLALLGIGVLMLLERDWWDRARAQIAAWWIEGEGIDGPPLAPKGS